VGFGVILNGAIFYGNSQLT